MTFVLLTPNDTDVLAECNAIMEQFNGYAISDKNRFIQGWRNFWAYDRSPARMQAIIDTLAAHTYTDPVTNQPTNAFGAFMTKAAAEMADVQRELPAAFADSQYEGTTTFDPVTKAPIAGATSLDPLGHFYRVGISSGWYWQQSATNPSGMMVTGPITNWVSPPV